MTGSRFSRSDNAGADNRRAGTNSAASANRASHGVYSDANAAAYSQGRSRASYSQGAQSYQPQTQTYAQGSQTYSQGGQAYQSGQAYQGTQAYQAGRNGQAFQAGQTYQASQAGQTYQAGQAYQAGQTYQTGQTYQAGQAGQTRQAYSASNAGPYIPSVDNPYVSGASRGASRGATNYAPAYQSRNAPRRHAQGGPGQGLPGAKPKRKRRTPVILIILVLLLVAGGAGAYFYLNPPFYEVTINGTARWVHANMTIQEALDENYATPSAGDLLAIDGSVYTEGGGDAFEAVIDGTTTNDPSATMPRDAVVEINDGNDVTEDYTESTQTIAHGTSSTDYTSSNTYWAGAIHVYSAGADGEESVKTGNVSGIQITEVTKEPVDEGYSVFSVNTNGDKVIALTFDDGPWGSTTDEILDILAENDAKATFFEIGNQCAEHPDNVKRIISEGHQIATHSYDHASGSGQGVNLTFMTAAEQRTEIEKGFSAIEEVAGITVSRVMRAPGGNYYGSIITNLSDLVAVEIGWDVDTEDWRKPGADSIAATIESAKPGNVILMHDGGGDRSQTVEGLRQALPVLKAQGYSFVTIDELLSTYTNIDTSAN